MSEERDYPRNAALGDAEHGDLIIVQMPNRVWSEPKVYTEAWPRLPANTPVVILAKGRSWPTEPVILVRSGESDGDMIKPGTVLVRNEYGDYTWGDDGVSRWNEDTDYITDYDAMVPIPLELLEQLESDEEKCPTALMAYGQAMVDIARTWKNERSA
ncbi:hypothetical protein NSA19_01025 [Actinomyces bowdenii]|uniref:hypothetical protein n=1 Tax=Actinomyces bowdenii TaxID=131109 RepID=UPI00214CAC8C|nr:hypothetical protein [Actinomyces bowdenii]MCR2051459.1 hypothetical protein [Actinomyces bowdenii]